MYIYIQISFYPICFAPLHIHICQLVLLPICPPAYIYVVYKHNRVCVDRDILLPHLFCSTLYKYIYCCYSSFIFLLLYIYIWSTDITEFGSIVTYFYTISLFHFIYVYLYHCYSSFIFLLLYIYI